MSTETTVAVIAVGGVIVSALLSAAIAVWQGRREARKSRDDMMQEFGVRVFEKRIAVYPQLHAYLSDFIKAMEFGTVSRAVLTKLLEDLNRWDSPNALLFSKKASKLCYSLRHRLHALLQGGEAELTSVLAPDVGEVRLTPRENLLRTVAALELALKNELGAYAFEGPARVRDGDPPRTYREAEGLH